MENKKTEEEMRFEKSVQDLKNLGAIPDNSVSRGKKILKFVVTVIILTIIGMCNKVLCG